MANLSLWLQEEGITICRSSATGFRQWASTLSSYNEFPHLRLIYLAAEPVSLREFNLYQRHFSPSCILINGLGSTETFTYRWYFMDQETRISTSTVPVGYPVQDQEVLLIDDGDEEVENGSIGEIVVRSGYLFPGYWRNPEITQAAFVPHLAGPDQRVYRTGDMGRIDSGGCMEHMGRKDFKVMVRGYSVETAEIEMALLEQDHIREAVVVAREDCPGQRRLVAYIVPSGQRLPEVSQLISTLLDKLPEYMLPSAFVILDALPVLPNGKLDRRGLPAPAQGRPELENSFVASRTPIEEALAEIWAEVLGLDRVGIHDNFLELGGDSLLASQVIAQVIKTFQVEVPLRSLFESPAIADMAVLIAQNQAKQAEPEDIERMLTELEALSEEQAGNSRPATAQRAKRERP